MWESVRQVGTMVRVSRRSVVEAERELLASLRQGARERLGNAARIEARVLAAYHGQAQPPHRPETDVRRWQRERDSAITRAVMKRWNL